MKRAFKIAATVAAMVLALSLFAACDDDDDDDDDPSSETSETYTASYSGDEVIDISSFEVSSATAALLVDSDTVAAIIDAGGTLYIEFTYSSTDGWLSLYSNTSWSDQLAAWTGYSGAYTLEVTSSGYTVYDSDGNVATESYANNEVTGTSLTLSTYSSTGIYLAAGDCTLSKVYYSYPVLVTVDSSDTITKVTVNGTDVTSTYDSDAGTCTYEVDDEDAGTTTVYTITLEYDKDSDAYTYTYTSVVTTKYTATGSLSDYTVYVYATDDDSITAVTVGSTAATYDSDAGTYTAEDTTNGVTYVLTIAESSGSYSYEAVITYTLSDYSYTTTTYYGNYYDCPQYLNTTYPKIVLAGTLEVTGSDSWDGVSGVYTDSGDVTTHVLRMDCWDNGANSGGDYDSLLITDADGNSVTDYSTIDTTSESATIYTAMVVLAQQGADYTWTFNLDSETSLTATLLFTVTSGDFKGYSYTVCFPEQTVEAGGETGRLVGLTAEDCNWTVDSYTLYTTAD